MGRRAGAKHRRRSIWPGTPVSQALIENGKVAGVRLLDQGVTKQGEPRTVSRGMDIHAALTVVGDGPVAGRPPVGRPLRFAGESSHARLGGGMKFVVDLPEDTPLKPGTSCTPSATPSRRSSVLLHASRPRRLARIFVRRGSTARCAPLTATFSIG